MNFCDVCNQYVRDNLSVLIEWLVKSLHAT